MFTGIVTDIGTIEEIAPLDHGLRIRISSGFDLATISLGASIACAGVCLTVTKTNGRVAGMPAGIAAEDRVQSWFEVEAWEEALKLTTIQTWQVGDTINLERSLKLGDEMGGHLVTGHIDGRAEITKTEKQGDAKRFFIKVPVALSQFIAPKGSVTLDGTSLTVNSVQGSLFDVLIIQHTLQVTTWGRRQIGDCLNLEVDLMARYAARLAIAQPERP